MPSPGRRARRRQQHQDDDQYAARLQEAVADLAQRVQATPSRTEAVDERVTDLAERVEATVARSQRLEATLATLAESLEGVTGGVEEAFGALQTGMAGLALDLARIDTTVAELVAAPAESAAPAPDPALVERLEGLAAAVQELAARPVADPAIQDRVADLAARLDGAADNQALTELQAALAGVEERLGVLADDDRTAAEIATQATMLTELRSALAELQERPASSPDLDARFERLETQLADRLATAADAAEVQRLAGRVEATAVLQEQIAESITALGGRLDELTTAVGNEESADRVDHVASEIQALATTLESVRQSIAAEAELAVSARLDELRAALGAIREDLPSLAQTATTEQLEELRARVEQLAADPAPTEALATKLDALESRLASGLVTPEELERAIADARAELTTAPAAPDERVDRITDDLQDLAARLEQLAAAPGPDLSLAAEVEALTERLDRIAAAADATQELAAKLDALESSLAGGLVTADELERAIAAAREELAPGSSMPDGRVDRIVEHLQALEAKLEELDATPSSDPSLAPELAALTERVEQLAATPVADDVLAAKLAELETRLASGLVTTEELDRAIAETRAEPVTAAQPDERIDRLSAELEALTERLDQLAAAPDPTHALAAKLYDLEARLASETAATTVPNPEVTSALDTLAVKLEAVEAKLGDDLATTSTVDRAVNEVRAELAAISTPQPAETTGLEESLAQLTERLSGLEAVAAGSTSWRRPLPSARRLPRRRRHRATTCARSWSRSWPS